MPTLNIKYWKAPIGYIVLLSFGCTCVLNGIWAQLNLQDPRFSQQRSLRLPNTTFPLRYHLHITSDIHLKDFNYTGNVTIDIEIKESTNEIVMHAKELTDFVIQVKDLMSGELLDDLTYSCDTKSSFLIIHPFENYQAFEAGKLFRVEILFKGVMKEKSTGLYWLTYENNNETVYLAATQSEPSYARLVFPCFDEPAFKSKFTIEITHGRNYSAISNMHVYSKKDNNETGTTTTLFYSTPPMSTYLVAFVISDYECISEEFHGIKQSLYMPPNSPDKGRDALTNLVRTMATLEDFFGIRYPLEKLDHIALKKNYGEAMENWGLITYNADHLCNHNRSDSYKFLKFFITQTHEIVHQWFGNLVSPEWWSYAWLNEGFATYFSYIITDMLHPQLRVMDFFFKDIAENAFSYSHIAVRPMTFYVEKESDIATVFDIISYKRSACVIKMFHNAFTHQTFMQGIKIFLKKFEYSVANEIDLFQAIEEAVLENEEFKEESWAKSIKDIMLSWTHTKWIPIVKVTRNDIEMSIEICQHSNDEESNENWWIPLNFATTKDGNFEDTKVKYFMAPTSCVILSYEELGMNIGPEDYILVNKQQTGFYHVLYDDENLMTIAKQLQENHSAIHPINRAALFQDLEPWIEHYNLNSIEPILELMKYLRNELDMIPWTVVSDTIHFIEKALYGTSSHPLFVKYILKLVTPVFHQLNVTSSLENLTTTEILGRQKLLEIACMVDLKECLDYTTSKTYDYIFRGIELEEINDFFELQDTILCWGLKHISEDDFNNVVKMLTEAKSESNFYYDLIYSLRCVQNVTLLKNYLEFLVSHGFNNSIMNEYETMMYISYLFKSNMAARPVVWNFYENHYQQLANYSYFVKNFNRLAEYVPQSYRSKFIEIRKAIAMQMLKSDMDPNGILIDVDSPRIGKKSLGRELFVEKFEKNIHEWLLKEKSLGNLKTFYTKKNHRLHTSLKNNSRSI